LEGRSTAEVRSDLGVDVAGTDNSTDVTLANTNYLSISGQEITGETVPITSGGTGATTASDARTALGVDVAGTDNSTDVTLTNTNYLNISGQEITGGTVPIASGGTGATTAATARTALGVDAAGTDNSTDVTLANANYLSISGQQITGGTVPIGSGGTGATTAAAARTALGLDAASTLTSTTSTTYNVLTTDKYVVYTGSSNATFTLPTAAGVAGKEYMIKNMTANSVTISTTGSEQIWQDAANKTTSASLGTDAQNNWIKVVSDGTNWISFRALY
jgi:hypothetical protein